MKKYKKDSGKYLNPINYSNVFHTPFNNTVLCLINTCKYIYKDKGGEYQYEATSFDAAGNVYFEKKYIN
jgi:hypothetical protein